VDAPGLRYGSSAARWVLLATVLGSGMAFLDATVVVVALPAIGAELEAGLGALQWTVNAYTLTLAALILIGGSLGDRYGRRRVFLVGVGWFTVASAICALAPTAETLVAARALQGIGGALLTPGSLAILQSSFAPEHRARAIGAWSGLGGIAGAAGPFVGGWLVDVGSWRWVFALNVPLAAVVWFAARHVPETRDPEPPERLDLLGAVLGVVALGTVTYALVAWSETGGSPLLVLAVAVGIAAGAGFVVDQRRSRAAMVPPAAVADRVFVATNVVTVLVYAALGGVFFVLILQLQVVAGFSAVAAGTSLLPVTVVMLLLSGRAGALGARIGPRLPMTAGPLLAAVGVLGLVRVGPDASWLLDVAPPVTVLGLGLALTVAPLTATVLGAVEDRYAGVASGVNNAVARTGQLLAVAAIPLVVGLSGEDYADPAQMGPAFRSAVLICVGLLAAGGLVAAVTVPGRPRETEIPEAERAAAEHQCALAGTPMQPPHAGEPERPAPTHEPT
jgi:EmrB/QacA subfamily drug resistance transporter